MLLPSPNTGVCSASFHTHKPLTSMFGSAASSLWGPTQLLHRAKKRSAATAVPQSSIVMTTILAPLRQAACLHRQSAFLQEASHACHPLHRERYLRNPRILH